MIASHHKKDIYDGFSQSVIDPLKTKVVIISSMSGPHLKRLDW